MALSRLTDKRLDMHLPSQGIGISLTRLPIGALWKQLNGYLARGGLTQPHGRREKSVSLTVFLWFSMAIVRVAYSGSQ